MSIQRIPPSPLLNHIATPGNDSRDRYDQVEAQVQKLCTALDDAHDMIRQLTAERDHLRDRVDHLTEELHVARHCPRGPDSGVPLASKCVSPVQRPWVGSDRARETRHVVVINARTEDVTELL